MARQQIDKIIFSSEAKPNFILLVTQELPPLIQCWATSSANLGLHQPCRFDNPEDPSPRVVLWDGDLAGRQFEEF